MRLPLSSGSTSRDSSRLKGAWGVNVFAEQGGEGALQVKRPGIGSIVAGTSPGQGLFNYTGSTVSVQNDVLHVGAGTFAL